MDFRRHVREHLPPLTLEREPEIDAWLSAPGAPEDPIGHRGFLFSVGGAGREAAA